jgi:replication factor C subunit 2/4
MDRDSISKIFEDDLASTQEVKFNYKKKQSALDRLADTPWVEKYRPKNLDDIVQQNEIVSVLKNTLLTGELPHLLLHGPPGTGKTSTILAMCMELFGPKIIYDRIIELNASDDRGISIVRNKILTFAKMSIGNKDPNYPCPDFKIIILDEADAMTSEAQAALRKVMEERSKITRFCFICNYSNQILGPISSRCMTFRFKPICENIMIDKLKTISKTEKIVVNNKCLKKIAEISKGDVRKGIMILQNLKYVSKYKKNIEPSDVLNVSGGVDVASLKQFWTICCKGNVMNIVNLTQHIMREGFVIESILLHVKDCILSSKISDSLKSKIAIEIANTESRLIDGSDEYLQLLNLLLYTNGLMKN